MLKQPRDSAREELEHLKVRIERHLVALVGSAHPNEPVLRTAVRESVLSSGKRLRPMMVDLAARDLGFVSDVSLHAGCAIELIHTASLLLDDLPCMDDALTRRGQPTIHIRYGEDVAILASIALLSDAFALPSRLPDLTGDQKSDLAGVLAQAVGMNGLVSGQFSDLRTAGRPGESIQDLNDRKTGALFVAAMRMAGILANASPSSQQALGVFGVELGRAFQLFDDLLDVAGDPERMGKNNGMDHGKTIAAQQSTSEALMAQVHSHLSNAVAALERVPGGAPRLLAFTNFLFGDPDDLRSNPSTSGALLPGLLA
ncbi:polyprenyl synthetase family protein [Tianweitania sediminis]|uniref:Polyprenyl synthetase family protein n=1 Tax=Tianweitania sediminis TaxID=1502156 RepID=A0A8J7RKX7_9HYPH|nr:polyprenyl synthetase family protein [Tianweitania sediminis]MBP0437604.1 polyprenyl synthetase family protein [Tianweitania sediminis]